MLLLVQRGCRLTGVYVQAVLFVRDLDRGILGRGSHGLQQYEMLRRGTDALVNGILRVRRLLKQKRTADADGEHPPDYQTESHIGIPDQVQTPAKTLALKGGVMKTF